jgi:hypothetical protein
MQTTIRVTVDYENNNPYFWDAFYSAFPQFSLAQDVFEITPDEWALIQRFPGWNHASAPEYAPHPLIEIEQEDEQEEQS